MSLSHLGAIESEQIIVGEDLDAVVVPAEKAELSAKQLRERAREDGGAGPQNLPQGRVKQGSAPLLPTPRFVWPTDCFASIPARQKSTGAPVTWCLAARPEPQVEGRGPGTTSPSAELLGRGTHSAPCQPQTKLLPLSPVPCNDSCAHSGGRCTLTQAAHGPEPLPSPLPSLPTAVSSRKNSFSFCLFFFPHSAFVTGIVSPSIGPGDS